MPRICRELQKTKKRFLVWCFNKSGPLRPGSALWTTLAIPEPAAVRFTTCSVSLCFLDLPLQVTAFFLPFLDLSTVTHCLSPAFPGPFHCNPSFPRHSTVSHQVIYLPFPDIPLPSHQARLRPSPPSSARRCCPRRRCRWCSTCTTARSTSSRSVCTSVGHYSAHLRVRPSARLPPPPRLPLCPSTLCFLPVYPLLSALPFALGPLPSTLCPLPLAPATCCTREIGIKADWTGLIISSELPHRPPPAQPKTLASRQTGLHHLFNSSPRATLID